MKERELLDKAEHHLIALFGTESHKLGAALLKSEIHQAIQSLFEACRYENAPNTLKLNVVEIPILKAAVQRHCAELGQMQSSAYAAQENAIASALMIKVMSL